ncbi:hypothetical protein LSAT2_005122 [Lamellibrachia satsuma]|nr:hypothetical protein LSAT2_005122 [Lamellibrachia satsuma]
MARATPAVRAMVMLLTLSVVINVCACSSIVTEDEATGDICEQACWNTYNHCMKKCNELRKETASSYNVCSNGCTTWFDGCVLGCIVLES